VPQQLKTRMILPALGLLAAVMLWAAPTASAAGFPMTISASAPTTDVSLNSGVYTPTASDANLNPADLVNELVADNVTITNATQITIDSSINASGLHNLTFNSPASVGSNATITVGGSLTFSSTIDGPGNLTLSAGGTLSLDGNVGGSLQLASLAVPTAASIDVAATIDTTGTQEYGAPVTLIGGATFVSSMGGVTFDSTIDGAQSLAVSTTGTASFDAAVGATTPLSSLTVLGPATASLGGNVTTTGAQSYGGAVSLATSNVTLRSNGGSLTFSSTVDGASNLTLSAGGTVSLDGNVGHATPLTSLAIPTATAIDVAGPEITTAQTQDYTAPITLIGGATFVSSTGDITFASTINGAQSLAVSTTGTASFDAAVGANTRLSSLTVLGPATALLGGNVTTTGAQLYGGAVSLATSNVTLTSTGGSLTFSSTVDGASNLTLSAGGTVSLDGTVGGAARLTSLAVPTAGGIDIAGPQITTAQTQDYAAPVMLTGDTIMVSANNPPADITFGSTVDGTHALTVSTGGTAHFEGAIGGATPLTSVTLSPAVVTELSGNVTTTGSQSYDALTMENDITFSAGGTVTFAGALTGAHQLTMSGTGTMYRIGADPGGSTLVKGGATLVFRAGALGAGSITLNGGTLIWGDDSVPTNTDDISSQLQIGAGGGTLDTNDNSVTFAHTVGGDGPLTKTGQGTLELNASTGSTYGNQIVVEGGTVLVPSTSTVSTPVLIQSGGELDCEDGTITGAVTKQQSGTAFGAPGQPTHVTATGGFRTATISFTPGPDNCNPVSFTAASGSLTWGPISGIPSATITATGLVGGQPYAFTVTATNPLGSSTSAVSNTVTPTPFVPTVTIAAPVSNATYTQGQVVDASYTCQEGSGGTGIATCVGPVASGAALDTQTPGTHTFTVTATSSDGYTATATATYTVVAWTSSTTKPPNKPNKFTIHQLTGHSDGSINVSLASLIGAGTVKVTEHPAGLRAFTTRKTASAKATLKFTVAPSTQLKKWLKSHHRKLNVKVSITYTPRAGKARTVTKTVKV
jgi:hypothetical protein